MLKQSCILIYIHTITALTRRQSEENPVYKKDFQSRNLFGERLRTHLDNRDIMFKIEQNLFQNFLK